MTTSLILLKLLSQSCWKELMKNLADKRRAEKKEEEEARFVAFLALKLCAEDVDLLRQLAP